jgi:hypothetical protein
MKVIALRNFSYGSTSVFMGEVLKVDASTGKAFIDHQLASEVAENGVPEGVQTPEGTPFADRETKPRKSAKPLETK